MDLGRDDPPLAVVGDEVVGLLYASKTKAVQRIEALYVDDEYYGSGLAQRLMEEETLDEEQITDLLGAPPVPSEVAAMERTTLD